MPTIGETRERRITLLDGAAVLAGVLSGAFGAYAYYSPLLRPLAHAFTLWIAMLVLVVPGGRDARGVLRAVVALIAAVLAFYYGKEVMYGFRYPGMPYSVDPGQLVLWCLFAVGAGVAAGLVFGPIGRADLRGSLGTAAAAGLVIADAVRRADHGGVDVLAVAAVVTVALVFARGVRSWRQAGRVAALVVPLGLVGFLLASGPDIIEQFLV